MPMSPRLLRPLARRQAPAPGPTDPLFSQVVLLLHFDGANGSTTFTDSSPSPLTVTASGDAAISTAESKFGGASLYVDGDEYATVAISGPEDEFEFGTDDFTLEFWCKDDGTSGEPAIITTADPTDAEGIWIGVSNTGSLYWLAGNGTWLFVETTSSPSVRNNLWHHIAYVRNGADLLLFLDGQEVATQNIGASYSLTNANDLLRIGGRDSYSQYFTGWIDEVRVTRGAGAARYTANFTPPTAAFPNS